MIVLRHFFSREISKVGLTRMPVIKWKKNSSSNVVTQSTAKLLAKKPQRTNAKSAPDGMIESTLKQNHCFFRLT